MRWRSDHRVGLAALAAVMLVSPAAHAGRELRLKLDLDYRIPSGASPRAITLRPMVRTEQRFRSGELTLLKLFVGVRSDLRRWLLVQSYYAHKDNLGANAATVHLLVLDLIPHFERGRYQLADRNSLEWHSSPGFYRYRNSLELHIASGLPGLRLLVGDEVRFDSDQGRLNLNDLSVGGVVRISQRLTMKIYYDLESNRRSQSAWQQSHFLGVMVQARL